MCDKAVGNYPHTLEFAPDYYKTQKMCNNAVNTLFTELFTKILLC